MAEASLQPIYERLNAADGYHPFSANTFTDWAIEAGDIVTISRETESYTSPVHSSHLSWRGSPVMTLQSRGKKELDSIGKATQKKFARSGGAYRASRNVAKKSSVYFQKQNPLITPGLEVHKDDIWIESDMLNTWDDICELTWDEIGEYTWLDFYGCKMYAYDGSKWVEISDEQKSNYNFDLLRNTQTELQSIKGDLSGAISEIYQSKEQIYTSIKDTRNGLESRIEQTAGQIRSEVTDTKNGLQSSITQTANQIRSEVSDSVNGLQSSITQNADKISLVVEGTGENAHIRPAQIVASINNGASSILLSADHIKLDAGGSFKLGDAFSISLGALMLKTTMFCNANLSIEEGHSIGFADESLFLTGSDLATTIKSASVSGNTLTLTPYSGTPITFSKATTLDSSWSGSVLTLSAKQNNTSVATREVGIGGSYGDHDIDLIVDQNGTIAHANGTTAIIPIKVAQLQGGGASTNRYTKSILVDMSSLLQSKTASSNGDVTSDSAYIGLSTVTVNVNPTLSGSWSGSALTVGTTPGTNKYTVGFGGNYGDHSVELILSQNGNPTRYSATQIDVPVYVGSQNSGGAQPTSRYTKSLRYTISSLLQTKTVSANGDVTPDSGYIGLSQVTVNVPGSSINPKNDISINNPTWYDSGQSMPSVDATLSTMGGLIAKNKQGYIYFNVTISGVSGNKVYRIPVSTI